MLPENFILRVITDLAFKTFKIVLLKMKLKNRIITKVAELNMEAKYTIYMLVKCLSNAVNIAKIICMGIGLNLVLIIKWITFSDPDEKVLHIQILDGKWTSI